MLQKIIKNNEIIAIFGLGKTGIAAFNFLRKKEIMLYCCDDSKAIVENFASIYGNDYLIDLDSKNWENVSYLLISPGVARTHHIFKIAENYNIRIISDIDLLYANNENAFFIAITGTNGKSTTTSLIGHIMQKAKYDYPVGGNIGIAALDMPQGKHGYILEISSFQLELTSYFKANIAIMLNITADHLERYLDMREYIEAKKRIFAHHSTKVIINCDNPITKEIYEELKKNRKDIIGFSIEKNLSNSVSIIENILYDNIILDKEKYYNEIYDIPFCNNLQGSHNKENIAAAFAAARLCLVPAKYIISSLVNYAGLDYCLQHIKTYKKNGIIIKIFNDSKATNADATKNALSNFENIYWIAGGVAKTGGIKAVLPFIDRVKKTYLFGKDKDNFANSLNEFSRIKERKIEYGIFNNLKEAANKALSDCLENIKNGKEIEEEFIILFSPSAASYDQFKNFAERGLYFNEIIEEFFQDNKIY